MTQQVPAHVAIIMDGNGRWAKTRHLPRLKGHHAGAEALRRTVKACAKRGVQVLTVYAFSTENWRRPEEEVSGLMTLMAVMLEKYLDELSEGGIRIRLLGDLSQLPEALRQKIDQAQTRTAGHTRMTLAIALNYGARAEIVRAARHMADQVAAGTLAPADITEETFASALYTHDLPDPDLVIRTSGEMRLSNFLLWQLAYSEIIFMDTLWPDFDETTLEQALDLYSQRARRYGGLTDTA